ncbi:serine hydrolase [Chitinophaga rhizophila]|uniref:Serine hydrolase n=1 Tax=Chitinophaga rhizophila TaxID=2866212 RepID=A0ABS7G5R7_9BACT|nr:serine hydrolase [Chitinophaga rhizophila]MBW8682821.1 serine hydrolase [Chitinophaga rhizophila]
MYEKKIPEMLDCGITVTNKVLGGKWKACIIDGINKGINRPSELHRNIPEAPARVINMQLKELEDYQIIGKTVYPGYPLKVTYHLTEKGKSLLHIIGAMDKWGNENKDTVNSISQALEATGVAAAYEGEEIKSSGIIHRCILILVAICFSFSQLFAQQHTVAHRIDSLLRAPSATRFNGVICISNGEKNVYSKAMGYADFDQKKEMTRQHQFIIGSISKQITAVIVLREVDKGRIHLQDPIGKYLPAITSSWADSVTIHQLLAHTHGITELDKPLSFTPGSRFQYGFRSYDLLSQIVEKSSGQSFPDLCNDLFKACGMTHSSHPRGRTYTRLCKGYRIENGARVEEAAYLDVFAAAGGLVSAAEDLVKWNNQLHGGKLLSDSAYQLMITKKENAFRDHVTLGTIDYGYGMTIPRVSSVPEMGVTGVAQGFISMDMYLPATKTSVIVLENVATDMKELKNSFYYHDQILRIVRDAQ